MLASTSSVVCRPVQLRATRAARRTSRLAVKAVAGKEWARASSCAWAQRNLASGVPRFRPYRPIAGVLQPFALFAASLARATGPKANGW